MPQPAVSAKRPALPAVLERYGVMACALLLAAVPLAVHAHKYPDFSGFWAGADQHRYLEAARAWAVGDLSPARHHYLPFYPLMGAAFVWLTPWQPFLLPDLACLLASFFLFVAIARRLAPAWPPAVPAVCFVVGAFSGRTDAAIWVVPWSTTGSAPFQFLALLLALRFTERPNPARAAWLGACLGLAAGFRPSDAALLTVATGIWAATGLFRQRVAFLAATRMAAAAAFGLLAGLLATVAAHTAIFGWSLGPYIRDSAAIGFEPRLLAMRWVTIVLGARPLLPEGAGLAWFLPWLLPGVAGLIAGLASRERRGALVLVAGTVCLHWAVYLSYRDLQPYGLWRFYNLHYFKWTFPFLALWAAQLAASLWHTPARARCLAACLVAGTLVCWRPVLRTPVAGARAIPAAALALDRAIMLPAQAGWNDLYLGEASLTFAGGIFLNTWDFKLFPVPQGALLMPLRQPFPGAATLRVLGGPPIASWTAYRQGIVFGLPCIWPHLPGCG